MPKRLADVKQDFGTESVSQFYQGIDWLHDAALRGEMRNDDQINAAHELFFGLFQIDPAVSVLGELEQND